mgnify:CR=1 FL=1
MRSIILAAGRGSRLPNYLSKYPKCFLKFKNKRLIDLQISNLEKNNIKKISIITGYKKYLFKNFGKKIFFNKRWKETNMFYSLLKADKWLSKYECLVSYGDIYYDGDKIKKFLLSKKPISILYDINWKKLWKKRFNNPLEDAETFKINKNQQIKEIGKKTKKYSDIQGQYMGIIKFTPTGWKKFKKIVLKNFSNKIDKIYLTDAIQSVIETKSLPIFGVKYSKKWMEIDNLNDYKILKKYYK